MAETMFRRIVVFYVVLSGPGRGLNDCSITFKAKGATLEAFLSSPDKD